jgi:hypothetical protein
VCRYPDTPPSARVLEIIHEDMYCEQYTGPMSPERRELLETACEAQRSAVKLAQEGKMEQAIVGYASHCSTFGLRVCCVLRFCVAGTITCASWQPSC